MPEQPAKDMGDGTHELSYYFERAGEYLFTVLLDGKIVIEVPVSLEAGPTDAGSCDLTLTPAAKGTNVSLVAGNDLAFSITPRDQFGNSAGHRDDAKVGCFSWRLQRLPPPIPKDDEDEAERIKALPPPPVAPVVTFTSLVGTKVDIYEAAEYELSVMHTLPNGEQALVQKKPVHVQVSPSSLSPPHCTLTGSGMHTTYVEGMSAAEREIVLTARDRYGNAIGKATPGLKESFHVVLRNTDPGLTNPMIDTFDLAEGNLGAKYGVRLLGSFTLVIELQSEELISKPLTIGRASEKPEDAPPDNEAVWLTPYSLHQERERLPPSHASRRGRRS